MNRKGFYAIRYDKSVFSCARHLEVEPHFIVE